MKDFAIYTFDYGNFIIQHSDNAVILLKKVHTEITDYGDKNSLTDTVAKQLEEFFAGTRQEFNFKYKLIGTDFQKKVWNALCTIPYGETRTYKEIATQVGNEKASRAVGLANNKNPISIAVPCHRVIGANGKLVGYAGGLDMKDSLLKLELSNK